MHYFQFYFTKCVLETLKSYLFYSFKFLEKRPKDALKRPQSDVRRVTFSGRPQSVNFEQNTKRFFGKVFSFSSPNVWIKY